eukprot:5587392-Prymnesium_polylepis.1
MGMRDAPAAALSRGAHHQSATRLHPRSLPALGRARQSEAGWPLAVRALRPTGGRMHVHANVGACADDEA